MNIGQVAASSGVSAKMIRYYEQTGLIPTAKRSEAGYRHYDEMDVHTLRFVRRARDLGFSVDEISRLLALWRDRSRVSAEVKALSLAHVAALKQKIEDLQDMVQALSVLAERCGGDHRPDCPIIDELASGTDHHRRLPGCGVDQKFAAGRVRGGKARLRRTEPGLEG